VMRCALMLWTRASEETMTLAGEAPQRDRLHQVEIFNSSSSGPELRRDSRNAKPHHELEGAISR